MLKNKIVKRNRKEDSKIEGKKNQTDEKIKN